MASSSFKNGIVIEGFNEVIERLNKLDGNVKVTTEKALKETHKIITKKAEEAIRTHYITGDTEKSLQKKENIDWYGFTGNVEVGFSISEGGLAHIFLMYGTPRMKKDQKLWKVFWSKETKAEIMEAQEEIFFDEIRRL